jgi:hypothetical protein
MLQMAQICHRPAKEFDPAQRGTVQAQSVGAGRLPPLPIKPCPELSHVPN